jgi:hypothetical protein
MQPQSPDRQTEPRPQGSGRRIATLLLPFLLATIAFAADTRSAYDADPKGWTNLLPKNDTLPGWTRIPDAKSPQLAEPSPWVLDRAAKTLVCNGDKAGHEYLQYTAQELGDFILHVEWRFAPLPGDNVKYNSGILFRDSADLSVWHQAQTGPSGGFLFGVFPVDGENKRVMRKDQMTENRVKPAGEWNVYEITAVGPHVTLWVNGATVNDLDTPVRKGYLALESEGYKIEFRNLLLKKK